jgi:multidrug efflux pump subunit AcrB
MLGLSDEQIQDFERELENLENKFGEEEIEWALSVLIPGFTAEAQLMDRQASLENTSLNEAPAAAAPAAATKGEKAVSVLKWLKNASSKEGRVKLSKARAERRAQLRADLAAGAGGTGAGAKEGGAADAALGMLSGGGGDEVSIADITTEKPMNVNSDDLEKLLKDSNKAMRELINILKQTQGDLSSSLANIDTSIDDQIATSTGLTPGQVRAAQSAGTSSGEMSRSDELDDEQES